MKHRQDKTHTAADIHEKDVEYLRRCLHTADMAADYYGWTRIPFMKDGVEREVEEKNDEIYELIRNIFEPHGVKKGTPFEPPVIAYNSAAAAVVVIAARIRSCCRIRSLPQPKRMMRIMIIHRTLLLLQPLQNIYIFLSPCRKFAVPQGCAAQQTDPDKTA